MYNVKVLDFDLFHTQFSSIWSKSRRHMAILEMMVMQRMVEIKCPPKRKFTKTCPPHYLTVQGQLKFDLDCDFQVKEKHEDYDDTKRLLSDDLKIPGRTILIFQKVLQ